MIQFIRLSLCLSAVGIMLPGMLTAQVEHFQTLGRDGQASPGIEQAENVQWAAELADGSMLAIMQTNAIDITQPVVLPPIPPLTFNPPGFPPNPVFRNGFPKLISVGPVVLTRFNPDTDSVLWARELNTMEDAFISEGRTAHGIELPSGDWMIGADSIVYRFQLDGSLVWSVGAPGPIKGLMTDGPDALVATEAAGGVQLAQLSPSGQYGPSFRYKFGGTVTLSRCSRGPGGDFYLSGGVAGLGGGGSQAFAARIRSDFSLDWAYHYGGLGQDFAYACAPRDGGGVTLWGYSTSHNVRRGEGQNNDMMALHIAPDGTLETGISFGFVIYGPNRERWLYLQERGMDVATLEDGSHAAVGYTIHDAMEGFTDINVLRLVENGGLRSHGRIGQRQPEVSYFVGATPDGGTLISGRHYDANFRNGFVYKTDQRITLEPCIESPPSGEELEIALLKFEARQVPFTGRFPETVDDTPTTPAPPSTALSTESLVPVLDVEIDSLICPGDSNAVIRLSVRGGRPVYRWALSTSPIGPGAAYRELDPLLDGLPAGTYYVAVRDGGYCQDRDTVVIPALDSLKVRTSPELPVVCPDYFEAQRLTLKPRGGTPPYELFWRNQPPVQTDSLTVSLPDTGSSPWMLVDANGCTADSTIRVGTGPRVDAGPGDTLNINQGPYPWPEGSPAGGRWLGTGFEESRPIQLVVSNYADTGTYEVVYEAEGCRDTTTVTLFTEPNDFSAPSVVTPNDDGINDVWRPGLPPVESATAYVFDRWGRQVFSTGDATTGWAPGTDVPSGVYFFRVEYIRANAAQAASRTIRRSGHLMLLR